MGREEIGNHLETIKRNARFKGLNKNSVSTIITSADPRVALGMRGAGFEPANAYATGS